MRCELRFGLLGTPVLFKALGYGNSPGRDDSPGYDNSPGRDDPSHPIGSPKVRVLLAALLLEPGRVVSVDALKDALWGGSPPASAHASLHNHVTRLRRLLDDPERLRAVPPGYVLRVDEGELDVHVFEAHVAAARTAHAAGDWPGTVHACTAALALWRGTPLSGLPAELGGYAFAQRLTEARLLALEWRYDAELALGGARLGALVPELAALVADHPLRESYHRQLMLALHHTGRQAEALAVHRDLRNRLIEELGIEPGAGVRGAHVEVLRGAGVREGAGEVQEGVRAEPPREGAAVEERVADSGLTGVDRVGEVGRVGAAGGVGGVDGPANTSTAPGVFDGTALGVSGGTTPGVSDGTASGVSDSSAPGVPYSTAPHAPDSTAPDSRAQPAPQPPVPQSPASPPTPRPAQLPPLPAHFTGRADTLRALHDTLAPPSTEPIPRPLAVISGMAGVGKSALALHAAHELRNRFPDGQLYVNLHGATPGRTPLAAGQALHALLRDLGAEPRHIPEHPDAASALLRSLLAPTRTLMVLDDAENAAQVRPLLPAGTGCAVIVTSRSPLTALDGARRFPLAPLSGEDSAALLRAVSGRDGLDAAHPLVELTGRLPLALRVVAARLAARSALTPDFLAGQLAATESRLHHLEYDDLSVRRSLAVAHDALAASERGTDRAAARALRHIGALDLPSYGAPLLARLAGTDERRTESALDRLVDVALLEETAYGRYTPHDLVRDFARELAEGGGELAGERGKGGDREARAARADTDLMEATPFETAPSRAVTTETDLTATALAWYAARAERTLTAIVEPGLDQDDRRRPTAAQPPGHAAEVAATAPFPRPEDAFAWGDLELENVVTLVTRYHDTPDVDLHRTAHVSTLVRLLFPYILRSGRVAEMEVLGRAALSAARRLGDAAAEAYALGDLAGLHFLTGRQNEALVLNDQALAIWWRLDTVSWIRRCLNNRGLLLEGLGRYAESGVALRQSLAHSRQLNDPYGEAVTHSHLGNLYEHTDPRAAIEQHRRSLAIGDEIGAVIVQHSAHCNIGYAHLALGEPAAAVPHFEESLRILGGHGDWHGESQTRLGLVRALRILGRTERADTEDTCTDHNYTERADTECAELIRRADARADRYMGGLARHQLGLLLREQGRVEEAYEEWRAALEALDGTDEKAVVQELGELLSQRDARRPPQP
ncbi:tetratricopeptide repeat protein [Streptomyces prunicolor]|uniref:AfsR/SARP family transcriptional regulator n=1 Tax=Streptomyces prunicolor TaxID=67348 RepID=UPI00386536A9|nr:tetratricopeptide repeat protein [Streptomyces prunicolor]